MSRHVRLSPYFTATARPLRRGRAEGHKNGEDAPRELKKRTPQSGMHQEELIRATGREDPLVVVSAVRFGHPSGCRGRCRNHESATS